MMNKEDLEKIREHLTKQDREKIAEFFNVSESYVNKILSNERHNQKILDKCINTAIINKSKAEKENKKRLEKISQLL